MLIDPNHLKTASFIVQNGKPVGTVFFIELLFHEDGAMIPKVGPFPSIMYRTHYAVTTLHTVRDEEVSIRFNLRSSGVRDEPFKPKDWVQSEETDLAVLPLMLVHDDFDIVYIGQNNIISQLGHVLHLPNSAEQKTMKFLPYGAGSEVFTIGLFAGHQGKERARPVVRFGHIALDLDKIFAPMDEKGDAYEEIDAFLIEVAAWQGQSGSPVFIRAFEEAERQIGEPNFLFSFLVGMVQATYPGKEYELFQSGEIRHFKINAGIAIVIPSTVILDFLKTNEVLMTARKQIVARYKQQQQQFKPRTVSLREPEKQGAGITRGDFEDVLKRASRKMSSPPDEGKSET